VTYNDFPNYKFIEKLVFDFIGREVKKGRKPWRSARALYGSPPRYGNEKRWSETPSWQL